MSKVIEAVGLTKRFRGVEAVRELNLDVPSGEVFAFLGPNGAGKTTTIKLLMNLLRPTGGAARVLGLESTSVGPRELAQIGYVSENQEIPGWMTGQQLLEFCAPLYPSWDAVLCRRLTSRFELPLRRRIKTYSRGMRMKIAMVTALAFRPRLLVMDEPFSGLDPMVRDELVEGVLELGAESEWTVFVSSHDVAEIESVADRVGFIKDGRLTLTELVSSLQGRFREVEVTLEKPNGLPAPWPESWLRPKSRGNVVRFVESRFEESAAHRSVKDAFPNSSQVAFSPMSLREIFVAVARSFEGVPV